MNAESRMSADASRPIPQRLETEQALLGAILVNNEAFHTVSGFLLPRHFFEPIHKVIFELCSVAIGLGRKADPRTLMRQLPPDTRVGELTGNQYIARLAAEATTIVNAPDYGCAIFEASLEREVIALGQRMIDGTGMGFAGATVSEQISAAEDGIAEIRGALAATEDNSTDLASSMQELLQSIDDRRKGKSLPVPTTGLSDVDKMLAGGLWPARLIVIAARPGMGKTVVQAAMARRAANKGFGSAIYSLEIDARETTARLIASHLAFAYPDGGVTYRDILVGNLQDRPLEMVKQAARTIEKLPVEIDATPGLSIAEIEARARIAKERLRRRGVPLGAVFIDYLQLVKASERYRGRRVDEVGEIAKGAKEMSKRLGCAVVLFSQLSREVEKRGDKRPILSDLRDSGNIEEHADVVAFLFREVYYLQLDDAFKRGDQKAVDRMEDVKNDLEFIIGKNRLGPTGTVDLWCDVARSAIDNKQRW